MAAFMSQITQVSIDILNLNIKTFQHRYHDEDFKDNETEAKFSQGTPVVRVVWDIKRGKDFDH